MIEAPSWEGAMQHKVKAALIVVTVCRCWKSTTSAKDSTWWILDVMTPMMVPLWELHFSPLYQPFLLLWLRLDDKHRQKLSQCIACMRDSVHQLHILQYQFIGRAGASPPSRTTGTIFLYIYIYIRESVDSLCRDGADTPMPPYIGKAFTRTNFEDLSLFRYMIMVCE